MDPVPWVCLGDFNEFICLEEKFGGSGRQRSLMVAFQRALDDCDLLDLGFRGQNIFGVTVGRANILQRKDWTGQWLIGVDVKRFVMRK